MSTDPEQARMQFLLEMYRQMWGNVNRHIVVIWQSISVLLGTFAVFALVEKRIVSLDFASSLMVLIAAWLLAHVVDANYWYNRNLAIIVNIERQFLNASDLRLIHPYFGRHRGTTILDHLGIQAALGGGVYILIILYHFSDRIWPGIGSPWSNFEFLRTLPYFVSLVTAILLIKHKGKHERSYKELLQQSPGASIERPPE
jgi:hypothetical protein